jgi:hypothetical protein
MAEEIVSEDEIREFNTTFVDAATAQKYTVTFRKGEPVLYHPSHLAKSRMTHIEYISKNGAFFKVANSKTDRTTPFRHTQNVLHIKLTLEEIEREVRCGVRKKDLTIFPLRFCDSEVFFRTISTRCPFCEPRR